MEDKKDNSIKVELYGQNGPGCGCLTVIIQILMIIGLYKHIFGGG